MTSDLERLGDFSEPYREILTANLTRMARRRLDESPVSVAEVYLLGAMWSRDLWPELQAPIGPYDLDFLFCDPEYPYLCVEVDGKQHAERQERDRRRDEYLNREGIPTLRIPANLVLRGPYDCAELVRLVLRDLRAGTSWEQITERTSFVLNQLARERISA